MLHRQRYRLLFAAANETCVSDPPDAAGRCHRRLIAMRIVSFTFTMIATFSMANAEVVFDVNFNELHPAEINTITTWNCPQQFPRNLPNGSIVDDGASAEILNSVGNLADTPVLLTGRADALSTLSFINPELFESGRWELSWDSLVTRPPTESKDVFGRDQLNILVSSGSGHLGLKYDVDGRLLLGGKPVGTFTPGISDHFDLALDLDSRTFDLSINGQPAIENGRGPSRFEGIHFKSPGRSFQLDPAPLAFDNFRLTGDDFTPPESPPNRITPRTCQGEGASVVLVGDGSNVVVADGQWASLLDVQTRTLQEVFYLPDREEPAWVTPISAVAVGGGLLAIGESENHATSGPVLVFDESSGGEHFEIQQPPDAPSAASWTGNPPGWGTSVGISGTTVLVGASGLVFGEQPGAVYGFDGQNGEQLFKLESSNAVQLGRTMSVDDNVVLAGSLRSAHLFELESGEEIGTFSPIPPDHFDFISGVAIDSGFAVVGTAFDEGVHVFDTSSGMLLRSLESEASEGRDSFGSSLAILGDLVLVGAPGTDHMGEDSGAAFLFNAHNGIQLAKLTASDAAEGRRFGTSVAIDEATIYVGDVGSLYIFDLAEVAGLDVVEPEPHSLLYVLLAGTGLLALRVHKHREARS